MKILIIRHGESEADILNVHEGRADFSLTERGRKQAELMAARVAGEYRVDKVYHSTLLRAAQTAEPLIRMTGAEDIPDAELMEFNNGLLAGLPYDVAREKYPEIPGLAPHKSVYGMESRIDFRMRAERMLSKVLDGGGDTVAVVSHGGMIMMLYRAFLGLPVQCPTPMVFCTGDTGIHLWEKMGDEWLIRFANDTSHLKAL